MKYLLERIIIFVDIKFTIMYTQILHPNNSSELIFKIPDEFITKDIKVMVVEINEESQNTEFDTVHQEKINRILKEIDMLPKVDMSNFKFNREEANER